MKEGEKDGGERGGGEWRETERQRERAEVGVVS